MLSTLLLLSDGALADEDDRAEISTLQIQGGKMVREKHEIEIYDYHSGTYQTFDVYRKPEIAPKQAAETAIPKPVIEPAARQ